MNPRAMTKSTSAAMAAALASCQPKAFPAVQRRTAAASTDQPRTLTTARTGRTRRPHTPSAIRKAGPSARPAVLPASDHTRCFGIRTLGNCTLGSCTLGSCTLGSRALNRCTLDSRTLDGGALLRRCDIGQDASQDGFGRCPGELGLGVHHKTVGPDDGREVLDVVRQDEVA